MCDYYLEPNKVIKARQDEPKYNQKKCLGCNRPLPFESNAKRCLKCKKEHDINRRKKK